MMGDPSRNKPKPYAPPRLRVYGNLRTLTQGGKRKKQEGGNNEAAKTKGGSG